MGDPQRKGGRPRLGPKFEMRLADDTQDAQVEAWAAAHGVGKPAAIRHMVKGFLLLERRRDERRAERAAKRTRGD